MELQHHGIKGMRWGVRRFQREDGTRTPAGKRREAEYDDAPQKRGMSADTKRKIATGVAAGAAAGATAILAAYAIKDPRVRTAVKSMATKSFDSVKSFATSQKTKDFVTNAGKKTFKSLSDSAKKAGKAMSDAAMLSMGGIAISKLSKKLETDENASEAEKNRNKLILDTATAGINSLTKANSSSSNKSGSGKGGTVGKEVSDALGAPSKKSIDKSSTDYQGLFKNSSGDQRDADTRATIKSLASAGYDIDQIKEYLRQVDNGTLKHSYADVRDELNYLSAVRYVDYLLT